MDRLGEVSLLIGKDHAHKLTHVRPVDNLYAVTPEDLQVHRRAGGRIAVVILNRPQRLNALTHELVDCLRETVSSLADERRCRAIVLTGAGRAFCAGADLTAGSGDAEAVVRDHYNPLITAIADAAVPVIAAVNGPAAGAGASIALACDLRVASTSAWFELPFVKIGLVPDAGATWHLPRILGSARAAEVALLGDRVSAEQALAWGLVTRIVEDAGLLDEAAELAERCASLSTSVGATKALLREAADRPLDEHLELEAIAQGQAQRSPDYAEARAAFAKSRSSPTASPTSRGGAP